MQRAEASSTASTLDEAAFLIRAMDCPEELTLIDRGLRGQPGVQATRADFLNRTLTVSFDAEQTTATQIAARLVEIGFPSSPPTFDIVDAPPRWGPRQIATAVAGALLAVAWICWFIGGSLDFVASLAAIVATVGAGVPVVRAGWRALRIGGLDMNVLMTIAATGAIAIGDYFEAATAMFLFGVALWLETYSLDRARSAVRSLVSFQAPQARRRVGDAWEEISPDAAQVGDVLLVRPGERLPLDGVVVAGASTVNQAPITGESVPIDVEPGAKVFGGSLNGEGAIEIRATKRSSESTLAHIARLVSQAQADRSPTARFVDQFARVYTPLAIAVALLVALAPPLVALLAGHDPAWVGWLHRGLVLLVIACPCALVISTPVTIVCGLHQAARQGTLVKGGEHLERLALIDAMAFDKTGTLTEGRPRVASIQASAPDVTDDEVLRAAAALEQQSEHPLAAAIVAAARERALDLPPVANVQALRGFGVEGTIDGATYLAGNRRLFDDRRLGADQIDKAQLDRLADSESGHTVVLVGRADRVLGAVYLADQPRPDAARSLAELRALGIKPLVLMTGDRRAVADDLARQLQLDQVEADLLPADKLQAVQRLAASRPNLAMVGDGVNDAPALAAAPIGIAMGSGASDTALETADVVIMAPLVAKLVSLVELARRCRGILRQNIALSLAIKAAVFLAATLGWGTMWLAVAADVGASLAVIANGMRLIRRA